MESVIKKLPINKNPGTNDFTDKFYQTFKEELPTILFKLLPKNEVKRMLPNSFYKASITTCQKQTR